MSEDLILKVKNLNVELGGEQVLEDLDFDLREKEILIILGPNGAGKSVLLRTLLGLLSFNGEISWRKNTHIGYVPEEFSVSKNLPLSVKEFFGFKEVGPSEIFQSFKWVGIEASLRFLKKRLGTLSSGQLRRTLIAWVLVDKPDVILLDEPMVGIDIHGRETIYDSLVNLWQEKNQTIILVSHEIGEVCKKADKILALNKRKLFYGLPEDVITPQNLAKIYGASIYL
ncbi:MAG: metal ABC transporter ATP-binding protein [Candidatus Nealsonbacteria bacterium]